jgi:uncharacterized repeat protein (TIGR03803 family)
MRKTAYVSLLAGLVLCTFAAHAQFVKLHDFTDNPDGGYPTGNSIISYGGFLYGITFTGGLATGGTMFKIKSDGTGYQKLYDFSGDIGTYPAGRLITDGTYMYGMAWGGGTSYYGNLFRINTDGTGYIPTFYFGGQTTGRDIPGTMVTDGTFFYGMTSFGGVSDSGVIFKIKPDGTGYVKLMDFNGYPNGKNPRGSLYFDGTYLYGMTFAGGTIYSSGTLFKIKTDGTGYVKMHDFGGTYDASHPWRSLISDGTYLFGMSEYGGNSNKGTIFKIKTDGTSYQRIYDFNGTVSGSKPHGSLIYDGTYLYGMTYQGGANNYGTLFKIKADGTGFVKLLDFNGSANGANPDGDLYTDGTALYGMTDNGGTSNKGVIFKFDLTTGIGIDEHTADIFSLSANPFTTRLTIHSATNTAATITLFSYTGKEILHTTSNSKETVLNTEGIASGFYIVRVESGRGVRNYKVVKQE